MTATQIDSCQRISISSPAREYEGLPTEFLLLLQWRVSNGSTGKGFIRAASQRSFGLNIYSAGRTPSTSNHIFQHLQHFLHARAIRWHRSQTPLSQFPQKVCKSGVIRPPREFPSHDLRYSRRSPLPTERGFTGENLHQRSDGLHGTNRSPPTSTMTIPNEKTSDSLLAGSLFSTSGAHHRALWPSSSRALRWECGFRAMAERPKSVIRAFPDSSIMMFG